MLNNFTNTKSKMQKYAVNSRVNLLSLNLVDLLKNSKM